LELLLLVCVCVCMYVYVCVLGGGGFPAVHCPLHVCVLWGLRGSGDAGGVDVTGCPLVKAQWSDRSSVPCLITLFKEPPQALLDHLPAHSAWQLPIHHTH